MFSSMTDYQASVARTPTPRRFDRCRQRILDGKPRLARVGHFIRRAARGTGSSQDSSQEKTVCALDALATAPSPDNEPSKSSVDCVNVKNTLKIGKDALVDCDKQSDCGQRSSPGVEDGRRRLEDQVEQQSMQNDNHLSDFDTQEEGSGMFMPSDSIDPKLDILDRDILRLGGNWHDPVKSRVLYTPSTNGKRGLSPEENDDSSQDICSDGAHDESKGEALPSYKKKSSWMAQRDPHSDTEEQTPRIRKASGKRKYSRPRRLPVNELILYGNASLLEVPPDSQNEDEDPIEDSEDERRRKKRLRVTQSTSKTRKSRKTARFEVSGATLDDFSEFRMPDLLEVSPNGRRRLGISLKCRDGFTGREARPTGNSMSMTLPNHRRKLLKAGASLGPALILVSQPSFDRYAQCSQEDLRQSNRSTTNIKISSSRTAAIAEHDCHLSNKGVVSYAETTKVKNFHDNRQQDDLQEGRQGQLIADNYGEFFQTAPNQTPILKGISNSRIAFIDDEKVLQSLSMVSAPMARMKSDSSDSSDERTDGNDGTHSDITDDDRSTTTQDEENDRDGDLDTDEEVEESYSMESESLLEPRTPTRVAVPELETGDTFTPSSEITVTQAVQNLALSDGFVIHNMNAGFEDLLGPDMIDDEWDMQLYKDQETATKCISSSQESEVPGRSPWMPRRPISTKCLIEVDEDIEDETNSSISTRSTPTQVNIGGAVGSCYWRDSHSQASIELGDPNWSPPGCQTGEALQLQSQSSRRSSTKPRGKSRQVYFVPASQQSTPLLSRSKTMPSRPHSLNCDEGVQIEVMGDDLLSSQSFRSASSRRKLFLSPLHVGKVRLTVTRRATTVIGPSQGRVRSLPFVPPFLRT